MDFRRTLVGDADCDLANVRSGGDVEAREPKVGWSLGRIVNDQSEA